MHNVGVCERVGASRQLRAGRHLAEVVGQVHREVRIARCAVYIILVRRAVENNVGCQGCQLRAGEYVGADDLNRVAENEVIGTLVGVGGAVVLVGRTN